MATPIPGVSSVASQPEVPVNTGYAAQPVVAPAPVTSFQGANPNGTVTTAISTPPIPSNTPITSTNTSSVNPLVIPQQSQQLTQGGNSIYDVAQPKGTAVDPTTGQAIVNPAPNTGSDNRDSISSLIDQLGGKAQATTNLQNQYQLDTKIQNATTSFNAYNTEKQKAADRIAAIYNDPNPNLSPDYRNQKAAEQSRIDNQNLANLSIQANNDAGNVTAAQNIIKSKLDAQFQPILDEIQARTQFAQVNNNDLTASQQKTIDAQNAQKLADATAVRNSASSIYEGLRANSAPASVYAAVDAINKDYVDGKISAADAQTKMSQAVGQYGVKDKFTPVKDVLGNVIGKFNSTTGEFQSISANGSSTTNANGTPSTQPIITTTADGKATVAHPPTGNAIVDQAQQLVDGNAVPSTSKPTKLDILVQQKANELSLAQTGKPYSAVDAAAAYKFRNSGTYQKFIANAPVAMSTINTIVDDAQALQSSGFDLNHSDLFNSAKLKLTANGLNPFATTEQRRLAKELTNTLGSISADDIGLLLGSGSGSDYKTKLGGAIFDTNGNLKTTQEIAQTVNARIQAKLDDYYRIAGVTDPSIYSTKDTAAITGVSPSSAQTTTKSGKAFDSAAALKAGYTQQQINDYLNSN